MRPYWICGAFSEVKKTVLRVADVGFHWPGRTGFALSVPDFVVGEGETVLLLGESGSGVVSFVSVATTLDGDGESDEAVLESEGESAD